MTQERVPQDVREARLREHDHQFRDAYPLESVVQRKTAPGLRLGQIAEAVMEGYADRPAVGRRARELAFDPASGRSTLRLLPRYDTVTYGQLWATAGALAADFRQYGEQPLKPGDFACFMGFSSTDYAALVLSCFRMAAVQVPLQMGMHPAQLAAIIGETEAKLFGTSIEFLGTVVDGVLGAAAQPRRLVVFDYDARDDDHREALEAARKSLDEAKSPVLLDTFDEVVQRGRALEPSPVVVPQDENPIVSLFYTSGSTGSPKGAIYTEKMMRNMWLGLGAFPAISMGYWPMCHVGGFGDLIGTLAKGGTISFAATSDLSTLFEDYALVRPTFIAFAPRVSEMLYHHYLADLDTRLARGEEAASAEREAKRAIREDLLGGRLMMAVTGSAPLAPETLAFMEDMLEFHLVNGYGSTEVAGGGIVDGKVVRPGIIDYKLVDVPELGYFRTDKPHPRGELHLKSDFITPGYYKQPELTASKFDADGFYATGDIMAELGPDHLVYVDRRNNVMKLAQAEFVAVSKLEALFVHNPDIRQIFVYGTSERTFLLAVVVPSGQLVGQLQRGPEAAAEVKARLREALRKIAEEEYLQSYEIPRDFIIETEPFTTQNGLLSDVGKILRPKLKDRYAPELEQLYGRMAQDQLDEMRALRLEGSARPALETVSRALQATLGVAQADIHPDIQFSDLGGDSLSALSYSLLLEEIFGIEVPVGVILSPAGSVQDLAQYIEAKREAHGARPTFASVHDAGADVVRASDLTLDKFIDAEILSAAPALPRAADEARVVLLTGSTGYLGRFLMLSWLERLAATGGKLICIARGAGATQARGRIESAIDTDPTLLDRFRALAADHLEVLAGDLDAPDLGLSEDEWRRLADVVDLIVHPAAHVNHMLPYTQLFNANVVGTAELVRLALTTRIKRFNYISTVGVGGFVQGALDEDSDIRKTAASCERRQAYANGYGISKWAGEVLLREAYDLCKLPVAVFRPPMILAHQRYAGQVNVPDMFTRLVFSVAATGVAPASFYAQDLANGRPSANYEGIPVDFLADMIANIGSDLTEGFHGYNLVSKGEGGSLDDVVDWIAASGFPVERIGRYEGWLQRFETALQALPEEKKQKSALVILDAFRRVMPTGGASMSAARFHAACDGLRLPIPALSQTLVAKYVADLKHLQLL